MNLKEQLLQEIEALPSDRLTSLGEKSIATCTIVKGEPIDMAARSQQK